MRSLDLSPTAARHHAVRLVVLLLTIALPLRAQTAQGPRARRACPHRGLACVRPFITDDARVVGPQLGQAESWYRGDEESHQAWLLLAYGPSERLELTVGGVAGQDRAAQEFTYALPLLQAKLLLRPYGTGAPPGVAVVAGTFLPGGEGLLKAPAHGAFGFVTVTQAWGEAERVLLHANVGVNRLWVTEGDGTVTTWGLGTQVRTVGGLHGVAELFSGDPYVPGSGTSWQVGVRHFVSDQLQLDATVGEGFLGTVRLPRWYSVGVRWVVGPFAR